MNHATKLWHYVYYSYEEWGRGYIGKRSSRLPPNQDPYFGSFKDKTFKPTQKIVLAIVRSAEEALQAEILLHDFYDVAQNPHFANRAKQTSSAFRWGGDLTKVLTPSQEYNRRILISRGQCSGSRGFFYKLTSPSGVLYVTINLTEFAKEHRLDRRNLEKVARGERSHHKGWTVERLLMKSKCS